MLSYNFIYFVFLKNIKMILKNRMRKNMMPEKALSQKHDSHNFLLKLTSQIVLREHNIWFGYRVSTYLESFVELIFGR